MEEIDKIIIDALKHMDCNIDATVQGLKQFDADMVMEAVSTCLEAIIPEQKFPKKLPGSMSLRLKIASNLAEQVKELGFRGDMGYQTILYCNEVEIRRVLMFLIERLPRDSSKTIQIEQTGYVPKLVKKIEESLRLSLRQFWLPSSVVHRGIRECENNYLIHSLGNSIPLKSESLEVPDTRNNVDEAFKQYWIHNLKDVTKQCHPDNLAASLLFNDFQHDCLINPITQKTKSSAVLIDSLTDSLKAVSEESGSETANKSPSVATAMDENEIKLQTLVNELEENKTRFGQLQEEANQLELDLSHVISMKNQEQDILKDTAAKVKLKTKTNAIISKEENLAKLKSLVENGSDRLLDLANQWNEVRTPLVEEYKSLQNSLSSEEIKQQEDEAKLNTLKETYKNLVQNYKDKEVLESILLEKLKNVNKNNTRSSYTRRILEIIGNINKQNLEIQKVLKDTKEVQKDINNLTGQVDRSFTLADEIIFHDAKEDEVARKSYKLLATLREEFIAILDAVENLGQIERECRNLDEQVETEKSKDIAMKLEKVTHDLEEIKRETDSLLRKNGH